jgi:hypothetical protein
MGRERAPSEASSGDASEVDDVEAEPEQTATTTCETDAEHVLRQAEFMEWFGAAVLATPIAAAYPEVARRAIDAVARWRLRLSKSTWRRLMRGVSQEGQNRLLKELLESIPVLDFAIRTVASLPETLGKVSIADLCSGVGYLGMFLAEMLPPTRVAAIVLLDKMWPCQNQTAPVAGQMNPEHIQDPSAGWPIPLFVRKTDLKKTTKREEIHSRLFQAAPGPMLILAVHLCGQLSIRAVELFNDAPEVVGLALKPCCLLGGGLRQDVDGWWAQLRGF